MKRKVWTRLQALLLAVILVATSVVTPLAAAAQAGAGASAPKSRPKLYIDFLGDDSGRPGIAANPIGAVAPADTDNSWRYSQSSEVGSIFWVGVGIQDINDLRLGADGSLFSAELGFYYNPEYVEPYTGAGGDAGFRAQLEAVNLAAAPNAEYQWDSAEYEITAAVAAADPTDSEVLRTIYDNGTQERDENGEVYTLPPTWKMTHVSLERRQNAAGQVRFAGSGDSAQRQYLMMIPFRLKAIDSMGINAPLCFRLARNASVFSFGGDSDGVSSFAAWERDTSSHPEENLKLKLEFTGDLNIFKGEREQGTFHTAVLVVENGGNNANNAVLSILNDPMAPDQVKIDWNEARANGTTTTYSQLEADTVMLVDVACANGYDVKVEVTNTKTGNVDTLTGVNGQYQFSMPAANVRVKVTFTPRDNVDYNAKLVVVHSGTETDPVHNTAKLVNSATNASTNATTDTITASTNTTVKVVLGLNSDYDAKVELSLEGGGTATLTLNSKSDTAQEHSFQISADTTVTVTFTKAARYTTTLSVVNYDLSGAAQNPGVVPNAIAIANKASMNTGVGSTPSGDATELTSQTISDFQRKDRTVYLTIGHHASYRVRDIVVYKADGITPLGSLTASGAGGTSFVHTATADASYYFTMPGEEVKIVVQFEPVQGYKVQLSTNVANYPGSTVAVTTDCPLYAPGYKLQADTEYFMVFSGNKVSIDVAPTTGVYATVTVVRSDTGGQIYAPGTGNHYEFTMPALTSGSDIVEVRVTFSNQPAVKYKARIQATGPDGTSAPSAGNYAWWNDLNNNQEREVAGGTALQVDVTVAPGSYIQSVRVIGVGAVPFTLSGNGYRNGAGGTETVNFVMPSADATVYIVYGQGIPPVVPTYTATLVVTGDDVGSNGTYTLTSGGQTATPISQPLTPNVGDAITGSFQPAAGYYITGIAVSGDSATPISWGLNPDGTLWAVMPAANIAVRVDVKKLAPTDTQFNLTLKADGTAGGTLMGTIPGGASVTAVANGTGSATQTLPVYDNQLVVLTTTNGTEQLQAVSVTAGVATLNFNTFLASGTVSAPAPAAGNSTPEVTATWAGALPPAGSSLLTFEMTDADNTAGATNAAQLTMASGTLSLSSTTTAGATASGAAAAGETVVVTWTLASGFAARPLEVTLADGSSLTPVYVSQTCAQVTLPAGLAQDVRVLLPVVAGVSSPFTANIITRMENGDPLPAGADSFFAGHSYSIQAAAGARVPFTAVVPDGYYISEVTVTPASLGVSAFISGQFGSQTGQFVMPAASGILVNVFLKKGWPDGPERPYTLTYHVQEQTTVAGGDQVAHLEGSPAVAVPVADGAVKQIQGGEEVRFTVTAVAGHRAVVAALDDTGTPVSLIAPSAEEPDTYRFTMPLGDAHVNVLFVDDAAPPYTAGLNLLAMGGASGSATLRVNTVTSAPIQVGGVASRQINGGENVVVTVTPDLGSSLYLIKRDGQVVAASESNGVYTYALTAGAADTFVTAVLAPQGVQPPVNGTYTAQLIVNNDAGAAAGAANSAALSRLDSPSNAADTNTFLYNLSAGNGIGVAVTVAPGYRVERVYVMSQDNLRSTATPPAANAPSQNYHFNMPARNVLVYVSFVKDVAAVYTATLKTAWAGESGGQNESIYQAGGDHATIESSRTSPAVLAKHGQNAVGQGAANERMTVETYTYHQDTTVHYIDHYEVVNASGSNVPYTLTADGIVFDMPVGNVTVTVYFTDELVEKKVNLHVSGIGPLGGYSAKVEEPIGVTTDGAGGISPSTHTATRSSDGTSSIDAGVGRAVEVTLAKPADGYIEAVYLMKDGRVLPYTYIPPAPGAKPSSFIMPDGDVDLYVVFTQDSNLADQYAAVLTVEGPAGAAPGEGGYAAIENRTQGASVRVDSDAPHGFVYAIHNDTMTVTVVVNEGYAIDRVETSPGGAVTLAGPTGRNVYTFTMPAGSNAGVHVILKRDTVNYPVKVNLHVSHTDVSAGNFSPDNAGTVSYTAGGSYHALTVEAGAAGADSGTLGNVPPTQTVTLTVDPRPGWFVKAAYVAQKKSMNQNGSIFDVYSILDLSQMLEGVTSASLPARKSATFTLQSVDVDAYVVYEKGTPPVDPWYNLVVFVTEYDQTGTPTTTSSNQVAVSSSQIGSVNLVSNAVMTNFESLPLGEQVTLKPTAGAGYTPEQVVYTPAGYTPAAGAIGNGPAPDAATGNWTLTMPSRNVSAQVVFWQGNVTVGKKLTLAVEDQRTGADTAPNTAKLEVGTAAATLTTNTATSPATTSVVSTNVASGATATLTVTPGTPAAAPSMPYMAVATYTAGAVGTPVSIALSTADGGITYTGTLTMPGDDTVVNVVFFPGYPVTLSVTHDTGVTPSVSNTATLSYTPTTGPARSLIGNYQNTPSVLGVEDSKTVSLQVSPDTGYQVKSVTVTLAGGAAVTLTGDTLTDAADGTAKTASFTMPADAVDVKVVFETFVPKSDLNVKLKDTTGRDGKSHTAAITVGTGASAVVSNLSLVTAQTAAPPVIEASTTISDVLSGETVTVVVTPDYGPLPDVYVLKASLTTTPAGGSSTVTTLTASKNPNGTYTVTFTMPGQQADLLLELAAGYTATLEQVDAYTPTAGNTATLTAALADGSTRTATTTTTPVKLTDKIENLLSGEAMTTAATPETGGVLRTVMLTTSTGTTHMPAAGGYPFTMPTEDVAVTAVFDDASAAEKTYIAAVTLRDAAKNPTNTAGIENTTHTTLQAGAIWAAGLYEDLMKVPFTTAAGIYAQVTAYEVDPATGVESTTALPILQLGITGSGEAWFKMPQDKNVQVYVDFTASNPFGPADLEVTVTGGGSQSGNNATVTAASGTPAAFTVADGATTTVSNVASGENFGLTVSRALGYALKEVTLTANGVSVPVSLINSAGTFAMPAFVPVAVGSPAPKATLKVEFKAGYTGTLTMVDAGATAPDSAAMAEDITGGRSVTSTMADNNKTMDGLPDGTGIKTTVAINDTPDHDSELRGVMWSQATSGSTTYLAADAADPTLYESAVGGDDFTVTVVTVDPTSPFYLAAVESYYDASVATADYNNANQVTGITNTTTTTGVRSGRIWSEVQAGDVSRVAVNLAPGYQAIASAETVSGVAIEVPKLLTATGAVTFQAPTPLSENIQITVVFYKGYQALTATLKLLDRSTAVDSAAPNAGDLFSHGADMTAPAGMAPPPAAAGTSKTKAEVDSSGDLTVPGGREPEDAITAILPGYTLTTAVDGFTAADTTARLAAVMVTTPTGGTTAVAAVGGNYPYTVPTTGAEDPTITVLVVDQSAADGYVAMVSKSYDSAVTDHTANTVTAITNVTDATRLGDGTTWVPVAAADLVKVDYQTAAGVYVTVTATALADATVTPAAPAGPLPVLQLGTEIYVAVPNPAQNVQIAVSFTTTAPTAAGLTLVSSGHEDVSENEVTLTDGALPTPLTATLTPPNAITAKADLEDSTTFAAGTVTPGTPLTLTAEHHDNYKVKSAAISATLGGTTVSVSLLPLDANDQATVAMPVQEAKLTVVYELNAYGPRPFDPDHANATATDATEDGYLAAVNNADHLVVTVPVLLGATRNYESVHKASETDPTTFQFYYSPDGTAFTELVVGTDITVSPFVDTDTTDYSYQDYTDTSVTPNATLTSAKFIIKLILDANNNDAPTAKGAVLQAIMDNTGTKDAAGANMLYITATNGTGIESGKTQLRVPRYYTLTGLLESYAPDHPATLTLTEELPVGSTDTPLEYELEVREPGSGYWGQTFKFRSSRLAEQVRTFSLTVEKPGNLTYQRTGITLDSASTSPEYDGTTLTYTIGTAIALIAGDIDGNGVINTIDKAYMGAELRKQPTEPAAGTPAAGTVAYRCDLNGDGVVTIEDSAILTANYRKSTDSYNAPTGLYMLRARRLTVMSWGMEDELCICCAMEGQEHLEGCPLWQPAPSAYQLGADTAIIVLPPQPAEPEPPAPAEPPIEEQPEQPGRDLDSYHIKADTQVIVLPDGDDSTPAPPETAAEDAPAPGPAAVPPDPEEPAPDSRPHDLDGEEQTNIPNSATECLQFCTELLYNDKELCQS